MKISIASDHGGFDLKQSVIDHLLENEEIEVTDCGTFGKDSCDYPLFGEKAARLVSEGDCDFGIVICTTGEGMAITANKVKGVRCALCINLDMAQFCRLHNNANVISIGAKYVDNDLANQIVDTFLTTQFEGGRHNRRVDQIMSLEAK
ncbi:MAG: ribose 5-phosphate isomerase B [Clostridia bacterium]|nr:ribose 5-phosphate isomerase B [Clostridia bacterium]